MARNTERFAEVLAERLVHDQKRTRTTEVIQSP
jgi:hypothetical protein